MLCRGNVFTEPLPGNDRGINVQIMIYAIKMGSNSMIYIPSFIKIDSGIQKLIRDLQTHRETAWSYVICLLLFFFQNKEHRLKIYFEIHVYYFEFADFM
jgi:hypothetical protein